MQIRVTERHTSVTNAVKEYARSKAVRLLRFYDRISAIEVILDLAHEKASVEMIVKAERADDFVARSVEGDFFADIDAVYEKLERQLKKYKEKHRNRKHRVRRTGKRV